MTSPETPSPLLVIERADALTGSGWMNARQAAYYTCSPVSTIRRVCRNGVLRHIRIGQVTARFEQGRNGLTNG